MFDPILVIRNTTETLRPARLQEFLCLGRSSFGDGDAMHVFRCKTKTAGSKKMAVFAHSNYTVTVAITDDEKGFAQGPANMATQTLMEAYLDSGY